MTKTRRDRTIDTKSWHDTRSQPNGLILKSCRSIVMGKELLSRSGLSGRLGRERHPPWPPESARRDRPSWLRERRRLLRSDAAGKGWLRLDSLRDGRSCRCGRSRPWPTWVAKEQFNCGDPFSPGDDHAIGLDPFDPPGGDRVPHTIAMGALGGRVFEVSDASKVGDDHAMELESRERHRRLSRSPCNDFTARCVEEISRWNDAVRSQLWTCGCRFLFWCAGRDGFCRHLRRDRASQDERSNNLDPERHGYRQQQNVEHKPPRGHCLPFRWCRNFVARLRWLTAGENITGNR